MTSARTPMRLDELDKAILAALPDEGAKIGRYIHDGLAVKDLPKKVDPSVSSTVYFGRLNSLRFHGLVVLVTGANKSQTLWQRTEKGRAAAGVKAKAS